MKDGGLMRKFSQITKNLGGIISKNSPLILVCIGCAGVVGTAIFAAKGGMKAEKLLQGAQENSKTTLTTKEKIRATYKCYIPAAITAATTITCIIFSNRIQVKRYAALAGLYAASETAFKEYKQKTLESIGKNKEMKIRDAVCADSVAENPPDESNTTVIDQNGVFTKDLYSARYFKVDIEKIKRIENDLNAQLLRSDFISLNDFYYELGLEGIKDGDSMGWHMDDGLIDLRFSSTLTSQNVPCLVLDFTLSPRHRYT